jgi:hypothetical protein
MSKNEWSYTSTPQYAFLVWCSVKAQGPLPFTNREEDGSWRKLYNDELHSLYYSPNIVRVIKSRRMRWAGHVARMEEGRSVYRVLVGRPERKRPLGRPRHRWGITLRWILGR